MSFPPMPIGPPPPNYFPGATTNPQEVVDRARWGIMQSGNHTVSSPDLLYKWGVLAAHEVTPNPLLFSALAGFADELVWFCLFMTSRYSVFDAFSMAVSHGNNSRAATQTLAEWVAESAGTVPGGPSGG